MSTYRTMCYIPTRADVPGVGATTASSANVTRAFVEASSFASDMAFYSDGMCTIILSIQVLTDLLPESVYATVNSQEIIFPDNVAELLGEEDNYDCLMVFNPPELTTATTFRGVGGTSSSIPWVWVKVGSDERAIAVHEFGHAMTTYLRDAVAEYDNFPTCPPEPAMHCNADYGYASNIDPGWLHEFLSGTLPDGKGINSAGWAVDPPTGQGLVTPARYREQRTPWGLLGPVTIS